MKKVVTRRSVIIILSLLLFAPIPTFAYSPQVANGILWVSNNQNADGSWGSNTDFTVLNTTVLLDALKELNVNSPTYSNGISWLTLQSLAATDILSRKIISLNSSGIDVSADLSSILAIKRSDGGWGGDDEATSMILDTALALQALQTLAYSDYSVLFQAVNFITSNQNTDGGWGFAAGEDSNVFATAAVLKTLSLYNSVTFDVQSSIDKSVTYLLSKQNSDGGFGSSPSTVYDSGLALDALIASGAANITTVVSNGAGYLTTNQLSNGSWNDDPYSTALALRALASARPNLVISSSDISLSKSMPQENESITITATVKNSGFDSASNIIVRFYLGDPIAGGTQIGTDQIIPSLSVNSSSQVSSHNPSPARAAR